MQSIHVSAFYSFHPVKDPRALQAPLLEACRMRGLKGTILIAPEGVNGTIAGREDHVRATLDQLAQSIGCDAIPARHSKTDTLPFARMKVRLKREIVTLGVPGTLPGERTGQFVAPENWNALIADPDVLVIDTRNSFEFSYGTFAGAVDPGTRSFGEFPDYVARELAANKARKIAMFCTGGIRCEKASSYLIDQGFTQVFQLQGGILNYLEHIPPQESQWQGGCFVFDERVALGHGLTPCPPLEPQS